MAAKPSVVIAVDGDKVQPLYVGGDAEKANELAKDARGKHPQVWKSIHGRNWERWKGKVEPQPSAPATKRAKTR